MNLIRKNIFFAIAVYLLFVSASAFSEDWYTYGKVILEYSVNNEIIRTPLNGAQITITKKSSVEYKNTVVTNEKGIFYLYNIMEDEYIIKIFLGNEELIVDRYELGKEKKNINSSEYNIKYTKEMNNIGTFIINKKSIKSMQY